MIDRATLPRIYHKRFAETPDATFGRWEDEEHRELWKALELPDRGNAPDVSRILAGEYLVAMRDSNKHKGDVYGLEDRNGRDNIEVHSANLPVELLGCIALGKRFGHAKLEEGPHAGAEGEGVLESREAIAELVARMKGQPFLLIITDPDDPSTPPPT